MSKTMENAGQVTLDPTEANLGRARGSYASGQYEPDVLSTVEQDLGNMLSHRNEEKGNVQPIEEKKDTSAEEEEVPKIIKKSKKKNWPYKTKMQQSIT